MALGSIFKNIIRIFHGYKVRIEKFRPRVTVWLHEASNPIWITCKKAMFYLQKARWFPSLSPYLFDWLKTEWNNHIPHQKSKFLCNGFPLTISEPPHDKTNKMACAPSEDSDQPGHLPSLITVFAIRLKKAWVLGYPPSAQRRLWSDWADAQADLSLQWAHSHFVGSV